jgi:hypothetical protein
MKSEYLDPSRLNVLNRIGDIIIPGDEALPKFSECGFIEHIDSILAYVSDKQIQDLRVLTGILRFFPDGVVRTLLKLASHARFFPNTIAANLRQLEFGLKGVTCTLYYACLDDDAGYGEKIRYTIGWDGSVRTDPPHDDLPDLITSANPLN